MPPKIKVCPKVLNKLNTEYYILATNRSLPTYQVSLWSLLTYQVGPRNLCNPRLTNDLRLRKITYEIINLFLQNKANFPKSQVNVTKVLTKDYDRMDTWSSRKKKPIQSQSKPIKANSNPIKANIMPKQSQFQRQKNIRMEGIFYLTYIHRTAMYINYRYFDLEIRN